MPTTSALQPIDTSNMDEKEKEEKTQWVARKLQQTLIGRAITSVVETSKVSAKSVVCLSPWGDSNPTMLPSVRFRDAALESVNIATGGSATIISPFAQQASQEAIGQLGSSVAVEASTWLGAEAGGQVANQTIFYKPASYLFDHKQHQTVTRGVKTLKMTVKYTHVVKDASLGYFAGSETSGKTSLFSDVKDYLDISTGWFCPYLYASARSPAIPRNMTPDVIFAHGPFHGSDYEVASTLLKESAAVLPLCADASSHLETEKGAQKISDEALQRPDRRMIVLVVGLKPFRHSFSQSARPEQSVINYQLLDGCPTIVLPVKDGAPLVAWFAHRKTLQNLWKYDLGKEEGKRGSEDLEAAVGALSEFLELCVNWEKVVLEGPDGGQDSGEQDSKTNSARRPDGQGDPAEMQGNSPPDSSTPAKPMDAPSSTQARGPDEGTEEQRKALRGAMRVLLEGAVRSGESKEVKKQIDGERAGVAMFRLP